MAARKRAVVVVLASLKSRPVSICHLLRGFTSARAARLRRPPGRRPGPGVADDDPADAEQPEDEQDRRGQVLAEYDGDPEAGDGTGQPEPAAHHRQHPPTDDPHREADVAKEPGHGPAHPERGAWIARRA